MKEFYRMELDYTENGIAVATQTYYRVHETECFYVVIRDWELDMVMGRAIAEDESFYDTIKRTKMKVKRFGKSSYRFAFETKDEAFLHLKYRKVRHLVHLKRDIDLINSFVKQSEGLEWGDLNDEGLIPNTIRVSHY